MIARAKLLSLLTVILALSGVAIAEIEKHGHPCETGICLYWWPKLPALNGWHQDAQASERYGANALAPDGSTFKDAETVMYAKAPYKPRVPELKSIEDLIASDKKDFVENSPGLVVSETKPLTTGDGEKFRSITFFPSGQGNWEHVSYGEEGEFYLIFTISSRTKRGYEKALPAYEALIRNYKEKL